MLRFSSVRSRFAAAIAGGVGAIYASRAAAFASDLADSVRAVRPEALPREENLVNFSLKILNFLLGLVGVIAVVALIYHGFRLLVNSGETESFKAARASITGVVLGILVIGVAYTLVSWLILTVLGQTYNT